MYVLYADGWVSIILRPNETAVYMYHLLCVPFIIYSERFIVFTHKLHCLLQTCDAGQERI